MCLCAILCPQEMTQLHALLGNGLFLQNTDYLHLFYPQLDRPYQVAQWSSVLQIISEFLAFSRVFGVLQTASECFRVLQSTLVRFKELQSAPKSSTVLHCALECFRLFWVSNSQSSIQLGPFFKKLTWWSHLHTQYNRTGWHYVTNALVPLTCATRMSLDQWILKIEA